MPTLPGLVRALEGDDEVYYDCNSVCFYGSRVFVSAFADNEQWVDMEKIKPGQLVRVNFGDESIGILYRTEEMINELREKYKKSVTGDDETAQYQIFNSIKSEYFVFVERTQKSSCGLKYIRIVGLIDSCTEEKYDFSGRSSEGEMLEVPKHKFISNTKIVFETE